jgi:hypothetical protein
MQQACSKPCSTTIPLPVARVGANALLDGPRLARQPLASVWLAPEAAAAAVLFAGWPTGGAPGWGQAGRADAKSSRHPANETSRRRFMSPLSSNKMPRLESLRPPAGDVRLVARWPH